MTWANMVKEDAQRFSKYIYNDNIKKTFIHFSNKSKIYCKHWRPKQQCLAVLIRSLRIGEETEFKFQIEEFYLGLWRFVVGIANYEPWC